MTNASPSKSDEQHTALYGLHRAHGARMVPFAGYAMPVHYPAGLLAEHRHTRQAASLFDVSHMGQIHVSGPSAARALERVLPIDVQGLPLHHQRYALLLQADGGILDDLMCLRRAHDAWVLTVNAATQHQDLTWLQQHLPDCHVTLQRDQGLLALQGPQAMAAVAPWWPELAGLAFMQGTPLHWQGHALYATRSGYTGEDGVEISAPNAVLPDLAAALLALPGVAWAGLGARNSLRLEAGLCLYGTDMGPHTTPSHAALGWSIAPVRRNGGARAGGFIGADTVLPQLSGAATVAHRRVGLRAMERIPVRDGTPLHAADTGRLLGHVTSGLLSPSLDTPIAMAYLATAYCAIGTPVSAQVRGKPVPMQVCAMPFVPTRYQK